VLVKRALRVSVARGKPFAACFHSPLLRSPVWRFDRFARSVSLAPGVETFSALGIAFVSLSEQMDTTTPTGKMVFTVLGAVADLERSLIAAGQGRATERPGEGKEARTA
jgi:DNA invertase Pin-like site-specific DNA recombinase